MFSLQDTPSHCSVSLQHKRVFANLQDKYVSLFLMKISTIKETRFRPEKKSTGQKLTFIVCCTNKCLRFCAQTYVLARVSVDLEPCLNWPSTLRWRWCTFSGCCGASRRTAWSWMSEPPSACSACLCWHSRSAWWWAATPACSCTSSPPWCLTISCPGTKQRSRTQQLAWSLETRRRRRKRPTKKSSSLDYGRHGLHIHKHMEGKLNHRLYL